MSSVPDVAKKYFDSSYFTFKTFGCGTDPSSEESVFALRYQVYCLERGFLPVDDYPNGLERDEYDDYSTYVSATANQTNAVVGALRVVRPPEGMPFPFQTHCTRLFKGIKLPPACECVEVSRVVISKVYRRRADDTPFGFSSKLLETPAEQITMPREEADKRRKLHPEILMGILRQAYKHCKQTGVGYWYVATEVSLARLLRRINFAFEAIGEEEDYYGPVTPYILAIDKFESDLSRNCPAMFAWFQASLDEGFKADAGSNKAIFRGATHCPMDSPYPYP